ncbi:DUF6988 family protein [Caballeronia zhejiangensis]|nr:hypothetical protein [Caballeronia zhejiangensis]EKS69115.1 hypothetical protein BURK_028855 [Burkholderia sp. SJ98]
MAATKNELTRPFNMSETDEIPSDEGEISHSRSVAIAINRSIDITAWIGDRRPKQIKIHPDRQDRDALAIKFFLLAIDHGEAIPALVRFDYRSSAFSLLRPLLDAYFYGLWATTCGDTEQMTRFATRGTLPKIESAVKAIDERMNAGARTLKSELYDALNDYTHGGLTQLANWSPSPSAIGQAHSDELTVKIMSVADLFRVTACVGLLKIDGTATESDREVLMTAVARAMPLTAESMGFQRSDPRSQTK